MFFVLPFGFIAYLYFALLLAMPGYFCVWEELNEEGTLICCWLSPSFSPSAVHGWKNSISQLIPFFSFAVVHLLCDSAFV